MTYRPYRLACESLDFQDTKFFDALVAAVDQIRKKSTMKDSRANTVFGRGDEQLIIDAIKKYTNITIEKIVPGGPAVYIPQLTANHIFNNQDEVSMWAKRWYDYNDSESVTKVMNAEGVDVIEGVVDMKRGWVSGVFEKMPVIMMFPGDMLTKTATFTRNSGLPLAFTSEEIAAIILHETGHVFTTMEYVSRTTRTNQALAAMSRGLDGSIKDEKRRVVFKRIGDIQKFKPNEIEELTKCKSEADLSVIFMNATIRNCRSQIGGSIYDVNSCEYLADQYASRFGAGMHLVTGLDKIYRYYNIIVNIYFTIGLLMIAFRFARILLIGDVFMIGLMVTSLLYGAIMGPDKESEIYDNPESRIRRIKLQSVERLKNKEIGEDEKAMHLDAIKVADEVMAGYNSSFLKDGLKVGEWMAFLVRPAFRKAHNVEMLQKELEKFAGNDLFTQAAKLKMV